MSNPRKQSRKYALLALVIGLVVGGVLWYAYLQPPTDTNDDDLPSITPADLVRAFNKGTVKPGQKVRVVVVRYPLQKTTDPTAWDYVPSSTPTYAPSIRFLFPSEQEFVVFPAAITCEVVGIKEDGRGRVSGSPGVLVCQRAVGLPLVAGP